MGKLEWCCSRMVKKLEDIFIRFGATHERDGRTDTQTDGHRVTAIAALCIASHGNKVFRSYLKCNKSWQKLTSYLILLFNFIVKYISYSSIVLPLLVNKDETNDAVSCFISQSRNCIKNTPQRLYSITPLTSTWPHLRCDVGLEEGEYKENCLCLAVLCTVIMVHKDTSSSYRSVNCIGLWSCLV